MKNNNLFTFDAEDFRKTLKSLSAEDGGKYALIFSVLYTHGKLKIDEIKNLVGYCPNAVIDKLTVEDDFYFIPDVEDFRVKRVNYIASRIQNRKRTGLHHTHVYLIKNPVTNLIKIGSSHDVTRRLIELKNEYKIELELIFLSEKIERKNEAELHILFKENRVKNEWFNLDSEQIQIAIQYLNNV